MRKVQKPPKTAEPLPLPRVLVRQAGKKDIDAELDKLEASIRSGWRLVVSGKGGNQGSDWSDSFSVGVTSNGRAWVLSRAEWGPADDGREAPEVVAVAAIVNPGTTNEDRVVQQLLDAAADWFRLDEIAKEGLFDVDYPGFE